MDKRILNFFKENDEALYERMIRIKKDSENHKYSMMKIEGPEYEVEYIRAMLYAICKQRRSTELVKIVEKFILDDLAIK